MGSEFINCCVVAQMSVMRRSKRSKDMLSRTTTRRISVFSSLGGRG